MFIPLDSLVVQHMMPTVSAISVADIYIYIYTYISLSLYIYVCICLSVYLSISIYEVIDDTAARSVRHSACVKARRLLKEALEHMPQKQAQTHDTHIIIHKTYTQQ